MIGLHDIRYRYRDASSEAIAGVNLEIREPQVVAIAGPNGSGKSTLLDIMAGLKLPSSGSCHILNRETTAYDRRELCRFVAHVPQQMPQAIPFTVEEVVLTGRTPHGRGLYDSPEDLQAAEGAMERAGVMALRDRRYATLSGGEQQRVLLAAAICQQPSILLLDEPGAHLDPHNESWLWALLRQQSAEGRLVVVVTHHLALAARHADRVCVLERGMVAADAPPRESLDPELLSRVFDVPFHRHYDASGRVYMSYGS